ncbi:DegT/DnrJ/EryC1/StrS family aminotransferase [Acidimicrobiaceae bacterium]|nr:DegT/DnrJ/EryC1/StrS family aminotransferase [Acidimicrobiaceae bacterium]
MKVPFNNLNLIHNEIKSNVESRFKKVISSNSYLLSDEIHEFENSFSNFTNSKYTISCSSGTDGLELILRGLEIGIGDEVILPTNSFVATCFSIMNTGATPIFVDCDEYYLINLQDIESKITKKTKAIIAVNLYGQIADIRNLKKIADKKNIYLIQDSAQSHGASAGYDHNKLSIASAYSFYPGKNLGAWGDAGAVTTNNKKLSLKIKAISNQGGIKKYEHSYIGSNSRMDSLQACVLNEKLKHIKSWNKQRNQIADLYLTELSDNEKIILPKTFSNNYHVWHLFVIRVSDRNSVLRKMEDSGITCGIHYPKLISNQKFLKEHAQYRTKFTNSSAYEKNIISLPIYPGMKSEQALFVCKMLNKIV